MSLAFALTPFWPSGMLSTLGHPLALWAFLNIRERDHSWKSWLTLGLLPLYSSIGEYIGKIFQEVKQRPKYAIDIDLYSDPLEQLKAKRQEMKEKKLGITPVRIVQRK